MVSLQFRVNMRVLYLGEWDREDIQQVLDFELSKWPFKEELDVLRERFLKPLTIEAYMKSKSFHN